MIEPRKTEVCIQHGNYCALVRIVTYASGSTAGVYYCSRGGGHDFDAVPSDPDATNGRDMTPDEIKEEIRRIYGGIKALK